MKTSYSRPEEGERLMKCAAAVKLIFVVTAARVGAAGAKVDTEKRSRLGLADVRLGSHSNCDSTLVETKGGLPP